jgi:ABC-type cobalamin/Fe3+-siderophores transport system ATPase subunit
MNNITNNFETILNRENIEKEIYNLLINNNSNEKKGIFIIGDNGTGKTTFIKKLLKKYNIDSIYFDGTDIRSSNFIENLYENNSSNMNVISLFNKKPKRITIIIDDIDSINNSDKIILNNLIKLVRQKKTKKQKQERRTNSSIIFIGNKDSEKKIKELMKVCNVFKINSPTKIQIKNILINYINNINIHNINNYYNKIIEYSENNLHKLFNIINIINNPKFEINILDNLLENISISKNIKILTKNLILNKYNYNNNIISENDRTIVALLYHENIIDIFQEKNNDHINIYYNFLENYCLTDFVDRIIYQKQIWQLNDLNFIIKILYNNYILNIYPDKNIFNTNIFNTYNENDIRFTKILTKYSTEYNNTLFLINICNQLGYNFQDIFSYFIYIFENYKYTEILDFLQNYNISELDINRINKIIDFHYNR